MRREESPDACVERLGRRDDGDGEHEHDDPNHEAGHEHSDDELAKEKHDRAH